MATLKLTRKQKAQLADLGGFSRGFWTQVGKAIEDSILQNIDRQKQADGSALQRNAPSTLAVKARWGRGSKSLVDDDHRFVGKGGSSWTILERKTGGRGIVVGPASLELAILSRQLQSGRFGKGMKAGKTRRYTGWMGINKKAWAAIRKLVRKEIERLIKKAERK